MLEIGIASALILVPLGINTLLGHWSARTVFQLTLSLQTAGHLALGRSLIVAGCGFAIGQQLRWEAATNGIWPTLAIQIGGITLTACIGLVSYWLLFQHITRARVSLWRMAQAIALENALLLGGALLLSLALSLLLISTASMVPQ